jgi:hypothetical protein
MLFVKPENLTLPKAYFDSLREHNADGVSCYDLKTGELFQTLDYKEAEKYLAAKHADELVVHFRFGTSGEKSLEQLHGWKILNDQYTFFHNGMLNTFKGDADRGLSDTQQFVEMLDYWKDGTIEDVVSYLEAYEQSSRFLIVNNETKEVIKPKCAAWAKPIQIEGVEVQFSNNYAIDYHLQKNDGHKVKRQPFKSQHWGFMPNPHFVDDEDDSDNYTEVEQDMINELEFIISDHTLKDLVDFITVNPEIAALYLKKEYV